MPPDGGVERLRDVGGQRVIELEDSGLIDALGASSLSINSRTSSMSRGAAWMISESERGSAATVSCGPSPVRPWKNCSRIRCVLSASAFRKVNTRSCVSGETG